MQRLEWRFHLNMDQDTVRAIDRNGALEILHAYTKSESLRKHALAVEACLAAYAAKFNENQREWSVPALLHDFDYEIHPNAPEHPRDGEPILTEKGVAPHIRRAILL